MAKFGATPIAINDSTISFICLWGRAELIQSLMEGFYVSPRSRTTFRRPPVSIADPTESEALFKKEFSGIFESSDPLWRVVDVPRVVRDLPGAPNGVVSRSLRQYVRSCCVRRRRVLPYVRGGIRGRRPPLRWRGAFPGHANTRFRPAGRRLLEKRPSHMASIGPFAKSQHFL